MRWDDYILIQTLHDGYHFYDNIMLFDLSNDPHELNNLAGDYPSLVSIGEYKLAGWYEEMMVDAARGRDRLLNVIEEDGPYHVRGQLENYLTRLRDTGRSELADRLKAKHIQ